MERATVVTEEMREQDARQRATLVGLCQRLGLLVVGYSGRDDSVMAALHEAVDQKTFPAGLFGCAARARTLLDPVTELLDHTDSAGVETALVEVSTFDELAAELIRNLTLPAPLADTSTRAKSRQRSSR